VDGPLSTITRPVHRRTPRGTTSQTCLSNVALTVRIRDNFSDMSEK